MRVSVRVDTRDFVQGLDDVGRKQIPFALALALTRTAQEAQKQQEFALRQDLDRPVPYTLRSLFVSPAKAKDAVPTAIIGFKDSRGANLAAARYLIANVEGGTKNDKRSEAALRKRGILPSGYQVVPGRGAKLDRYGNQTRREVNRVLKAIGPDGKGKGTNFFTLPPRFGRPGGVFERISNNKKLRPVMIFVRNPRYSVRYPFFDINEKVFRSRLQRNFGRSLQQALNTARR